MSGVLDKVATVENGAYNELRNIKKSLKKEEEVAPVEAQPVTEEKVVEEVAVSEPLTPVEEVTHWEEPAEQPKKDNESIIGGLKRFKNKISDKVNLDIDSILKVSSLDIDKHFEKIKNAADNALHQAREQMSEVKGKVEKLDVSKVTSIEKVKNLAKKFQIKRKKDE